MAAVKSERVLQGAIVLCLGLLAWVVADTFREKVVVAGDTAPDFSVTTDNGRTLSRSDFGGKLLVLNFWATWCPPCLEELPSLNEFQQALADSGVVVLGVSVDANPKQYQAFLKRAKVAFQTARDPDAKIPSQYGTYQYPETYIIDRDGKVVEKVVGATSWTDPAMINRVKALLAS
jgi:cytochrome c biogenesis protein CcmG, thiol:disulfide interchange protein DsbE